MIIFAKMFRLKQLLFNIFFSLVFSSASLILQAQNTNNPGDFIIRYHDGQVLQTNQLIQLWSINNGNSVYQYRWSIPYVVSCEPVIEPDGRIRLNYALKNGYIRGNTKFRDFKMDSLLIPDSALYQLNWNSGEQSISSRIIKGRFGKGVFLVSAPQDFMPENSRCTLRLDRIYYSKQHLDKIFARAALINHYYGYQKLMHSVTKWVNQKTAGLHPDASALFYSEQVLLRLVAYIDQHDIVEALRLSSYDPDRFSPQFEAIKRLLLRMHSLAQQRMQTPDENQAADKARFVTGFLSVSKDALDEGSAFQPYVSASFHEFAALPDTIGFHLLAQTANFYDARDSSGTLPVLQQLYEGFIQMGSIENDRDNFVDAFLLLDNALQLEKGFRTVKEVPEWKLERFRAIQGLAVSYLKVAQSALTLHNREMADSYFPKATRLLNRYLKDTAFNGFRFTAYAEAVIKLAGQYETEGQYDQSFLLLKQAMKATRGAIFYNHKSDFSQRVKSLRKRYLLRCSRSIDLNQFEEAEANLQSAIQIHSTFYQTFGEDFRKDEALHNLALRLYHFILDDVAVNFEKKDFSMVSRQINAARALQQQFQLPELEWASVSKKWLIPYLKDEMNRVAFQIWAHRPVQAIRLYRHADSLSRVFQVDNEQEVRQSFEQLKVKIANVRCEMGRNQWENLNNRGRQMLQSHRMVDAIQCYRKAWTVTKKYAATSCFSKTQQDSAKKQYHTLVEFERKQQAFTAQLFQSGIYAVLPQFVALDKAYYDAKLDALGYAYTDLYQFVNKQKSIPVARAVIDYFVKNQEFRQAFRYLQLLYRWEGTTRYVIAYKKRIIRGFAEHGLKITDVERSDKKDPWINDFRSALKQYRQHMAE